jgi:hypothetical protein
MEWSRYFCYASPAAGSFRFRSVITTTKIPNNSEHGGAGRKNICRPPLANQAWAIEWSSYFCHAAPPSVSFRFWSVIATTKIANNSETVELDEKYL